jgi:CheY-like chemotaxis protein
MTGLALEEVTSEKQRGYLTHGQKASQSLLTLVNDIEEFSRVEAGDVELKAVNFNLQECLQAELRAAELRAREKGLTVARQIDPEVPQFVVGDDHSLGRLLSNLVGNAIKFSSSGEIRVNVRPVVITEEYAELEFIVTDTGIGVPANQQRSIFGAFEQADGSGTRKYGGAGFGLAMCERLVNLMHGSIWVESPWRSPETHRMVQGSAFHFTVKINPGKAPVVQAPKLVPAAISRTLRILLAEDNPVNQKLVVHLLQRRGHTVAVANNGREAVEIAKHENVDLVLMDVQMPEMDGFQATAAIRTWEQGRRTPLCIVALTAHAMDGEKERCLANGFDLYLAKPFRPDELDRVLAEGVVRNDALAG